MPDFIPPWFVPACLAVLGACIGSFLNVVIYRSPLGLPLGDPKRSFCPSCKTPIKWYQNIPVISWLVLRGKCAACKARISARYILVELLTMGLFLAIGLVFDTYPVETQLLMCLWGAVAIAVAFIDAETMIVIPSQTVAGACLGLLAALSYPLLVDGEPCSWIDGLYLSLLGAGAGFILIRIVIELGKLLFGSWSHTYDQRAEWHLKEPKTDSDELTLVLPDRECPWSELFGRKTDKAIFKNATLFIDGEEIRTDEVTLYEDRIEGEFGNTFMIEDIGSARGTLVTIKANREAMGSGDAWIMLMIGAMFGWQGSIFALVSGSIIGILLAVVTRLGFNRPMPFGPSLLIGALFWLFYGQKLWVSYLTWIGYY